MPKPSAAAIAAAAAGAATLRSVAANAEGAPKGFVARKGGGLAGTAPRAPASPEPKTRRLSTGVGALGGGAGHGAPAAAPKQKATTLTPAAAGALAASLTPRVTALAKAGGAWPPTAVQAGVWAAVAAGRDVTAVAPPGAGKTLAYAVPAAAAAAERKAPASTASTSSPVAVILVPARELATQVAAVCTGLRRGGGTGSGVRTALVVGGVDRAAQAAGVKSAAVLVATPGRLLDLVDAGQVDLGMQEWWRERAGGNGHRPAGARRRVLVRDEVGAIFFSFHSFGRAREGAGDGGACASLLLPSFATMT